MSNMLQQILEKGFIDQELLDELSDDQKQILFYKMRQEQIRKWKEFDAKMEDEDRRNKRSSKREKKKKVDFLKGRDGCEWVWVMGEHRDDKSIDQILEDEAHALARKQAEAEAKALREKEEAEIHRKLEEERLRIIRENEQKEAELKRQQEEAAALYQSIKEARLAAERLEIAKKKMEEEEKKRLSEIEEKEKKARRQSREIADSMKEKRSSEIYSTLQKKRQEFEKQAEEGQKEVETSWKEQEKKAKEADIQMRQKAKQARDEYRESLRRSLTMVQATQAFGGNKPAIPPNCAHAMTKEDGLKFSSQTLSQNGDSRAGKSCILTRYIRNQFSYEYIQTQKVAVENVVKKLNVPGHAAVPISFWDIPGNEDIHLYPSYFKDLDAVIVVVDVTDPESRESGRLWHQTVLDTASFTAHDAEENTQVTNDTNGEWELKRKIQNVNDIPFLLLGNKHDLVKQANLRDEKTENTGLNEENIQHYPDFTRYLDEVAGDGFHGSALVSARANDLSVDGTIQSFLRQILEKDYVARRWQAHENVHKGKRPRYKFQPQMEVVGFKEIDDEFSKADEIIYRVTSLRNYQKESLDKFCEQCVKGGVVESAEAVNMQDCLVSLKEKLESKDLKLKLTLLDEFFILEVKASEDNAVLETPIRYAIKTFNKEYAAVTKAILAEYPLAKDKLNRIAQKVEKLCQQHEVLSSDTSQNTDVISDKSSRDRTPVEKNLAMIQHITRKCHDSLAHIQRSVKQAKAAFVW